MSKKTIVQEPLPLPLGFSDFSQLREYGAIYIDKTSMIFKLAKPVNHIFLARPRRFGKSLLVSTFYSLFKNGLKDFSGLEIEKLWKDEKKYSVVKLDFSEEKEYEDGNDFERKFNAYLIRYLKANHLCEKSSLSSDGINEFASWLERQPNSSVVLLIDEYDAPLTAALNDQETFFKVRKVLASFYSKLKVRTRAFRFLFLTGITKFSNASIFLELNNLQDISLDPEFGGIVGYTLEELRHYFKDYIKHAATILGLSEEKLLKELVANYNGFCFEVTAKKKVFAPWSVLNFFNRPHMGFKNYWFESGGQPSLLLQYVKEHSLQEPSEYVKKQLMTVEDLSATSLTNEINEIVLLFQTGYLTIKASENDALKLGYPNREVANSMAALYLNRFLKGKTLAQVKAMNIPLVLVKGEVEKFIDRINSIFLALDYDRYYITNEKQCENSLLLILHGSGLQAKIETHNALGRSDLEFGVGNTHWVLELKFARKEEEILKLLDAGLKQIRSRHYGEQNFGRKLICLVMVFFEKERQFVKYSYEEA